MIGGKGVKECGCRIRAKAIRKLERIPPEYEHLRIESVAPDSKRHPMQDFVWQTVKKHPDQCYLIRGQPGAEKSAELWALYARAAEQNRPAVAMSLSEWIEDFRRAETTRCGNEYLPELHPSKLQTGSDRWFVGPGVLRIPAGSQAHRCSRPLFPGQYVVHVPEMRRDRQNLRASQMGAPGAELNSSA